MKGRYASNRALLRAADDGEALVILHRVNHPQVRVADEAGSPAVPHVDEGGLEVVGANLFGVQNSSSFSPEGQIGNVRVDHLKHELGAVAGQLLHIVIQR